ncbi:helix-turn-helix domain-containing protein [Novosphingobium sp.]|uniref:helix-turn-helix domain-containing protein n=1 Tax=Novosphingobium sp. TaxID=1874826 RepID=UPI0022BE40FB|nr:helix-turn-helix domain-containing protein [Novosphingobium sp.]MCZ8018206.1 helix-turn-helix domain-containing protein [Novosphingobium sp.]MCZ8033200.1 helix-turn-helix domain-containing protein [Novosphingobium sp.]MCZ8051655.1 helix-turn-helix domain-containing protein [Novosphingobium sp.]MCZ8060197.1 helix-turn-helix domain-containing protein [Novosphingobium sp.]MCZ8231839.1 helix-turn-helix domain-containing protein [Novosphingobium sp.]
MVTDEEHEAELPLESPGVLLARAREAAGKTRAQIAAQTRISERQIEAIEQDRFADLPSRTYAIGFSRTYAKAVGLDGNAITAMVRDELGRQQPEYVSRPTQAFEPGDPARLPGSRVAWFAAAGLALVLLAGFAFWPNLFAPGGSLPSLLPRETPVAVAKASPAPAPVAMPADGPVVFTATRDKVWVRFADAQGQQLLQKELALGESWTLPTGLPGVTLTTARPDGLAITVGGRAVAPLSASQQLMRDVPVTGAALLARGNASPAASDAAAAAATALLPARPAARPAAQRAATPLAAPTEAVPTAAPATEPTTAPATTTNAGTADS